MVGMCVVILAWVIEFVVMGCGVNGRRSEEKQVSDVDGHLRLKIPYPVRSAKSSSFKLG